MEQNTTVRAAGPSHHEPTVVETSTVEPHKKSWPKEELENLATQMNTEQVPVLDEAGRSLGVVTSADVTEEHGLEYELLIEDEEIAEKLRRDLVRPMPWMKHKVAWNCDTVEIDGEEVPVIEDAEMESVTLISSMADLDVQGVEGVLTEQPQEMSLREYLEGQHE